MYLSVVYRAVLRKKALLEGDADHVPNRKGELPAPELIVVALENCKPLPDGDVLVLAEACDISAVKLTGASLSPLEADGSP
jgi:hypothetical protein